MSLQHGLAADASEPRPDAADPDGAFLRGELHDVPPLAEALTAEYLEHHGVLPVRLADDEVVCASWRSGLTPQAARDLHLLFGVRPRLVPAPEAEVRAAIRRAYGGEPITARDLIAGLPELQPERDGDVALDDLVQLANEPPVVQLVNLLLIEALEARASDVHLEAYRDRLRVRYRVDGVLHEAPTPPPQMMAAIVSRLKIMSELDIAERRLPQDGRIRLRLQDRQVDVRVATLPTLHGESVVLRLLDRESARIALPDLGMAEDTLQQLADAAARPHGILLATGPTGSGKTTTLYALTDRLRTGREKMLTVEDPVEYELAGVPQVPVNEKVGLTFATALRALLRQDPDVLLVGEIRDQETAEIATHAALTGHLVLSTLHTNDAASALTRLLDLGVAPFLVASTVEAVLAQRLVRTLCRNCALPSEAPAPGARSASFARGPGCARCHQTGYRGRTGIYELLVMDDDLRAEVVKRSSAAELRRLAVAGGMRTLREDGLRQVLAGVTTTEEVLRVTRD